MPRVVLVGDSILDNGPYTHPHPDTRAHLAVALGNGWNVERLAQDGARMADVRRQLDGLEGRADVAVLSVGGNDLTHHVGILDRASSGSSEVLRDLTLIADEFATSYEAVAKAVAARSERTILCTVYEVQLEPRRYAELVRVPLAVMNDRIVGVATQLGLDVLELRAVCTEPSDFVLQIEPSPVGAEKIAHAIASALAPEGVRRRTRIFGA